MTSGSKRRKINYVTRKNIEEAEEDTKKDSDEDKKESLNIQVFYRKLLLS